MLKEKRLDRDQKNIMEGIVFTMFENLDVSTLSYEESMDCLYYLDILLEQDEGPESFVRYQLLKLKIKLRISEFNKKTGAGPFINLRKTIPRV